MTYEKILNGTIKALITKFSIYGLDDGDIDIIEKYRDKLSEDKKEIPGYLSEFLNSSLYIERYDDVPEIDMIERVGATGVRLKLSACLALKNGEEIKEEVLSKFMNENLFMWDNVDISNICYICEFGELKDELKEMIKLKEEGNNYIFSVDLEFFLKERIKADSQEELMKNASVLYDEKALDIIKNGFASSVNLYIDDEDMFTEKNYI